MLNPIQSCLIYIFKIFTIWRLKSSRKSRYGYITHTNTKSKTFLPSLLMSNVSLLAVMDRTKQLKDNMDKDLPEPRKIPRSDSRTEGEIQDSSNMLWDLGRGSQVRAGKRAPLAYQPIFALVPRDQFSILYLDFA